MLPRRHPDRIRIAFDDHRLVANAGLIIPATLALRLGLPQLLRKHLDLGGAPGRANTGDKMLTLVASAGPPACSVSRSRLPPPWAPSCAASVGARSVNWTGWAASCWPGPGRPGPDPATGP